MVSSTSRACQAVVCSAPVSARLNRSGQRSWPESAHDGRHQEANAQFETLPNEAIFSGEVAVFHGIAWIQNEAIPIRPSNVLAAAHSKAMRLAVSRTFLRAASWAAAELKIWTSKANLFSVNDRGTMPLPEGDPFQRYCTTLSWSVGEK
jgi:hypothetical protein